MPIRVEPKATASRLINPHISYCAKCGVSWMYVKPHTIWLLNNDIDKESGTISTGVFYMCEECWTESTIEDHI